LSRFWPAGGAGCASEAGHRPPLASEGVCPLLDPQIAPPAGKTKPRCCDSRFDSANEPGQFLALRKGNTGFQPAEVVA
jgi:hypothetical protein